MVTLTDADKATLEADIEAAERGTSAEIVLVVAETCDDYRAHTFIAAAIAGLIALGTLALLLPHLHVRVAFLSTVIVVVVAAALLQWRPLRMLAVPRAVREDAAERLAHAEFAAAVQHRTAAANGVLIFVALAEHCAEIIADSGLAARVPKEAWQKIMDALIAEMRAGRTVDGLRAAIAACGAEAAAVYPPQAGDINEIPNAPQNAGSR